MVFLNLRRPEPSYSSFSLEPLVWVFQPNKSVFSASSSTPLACVVARHMASSLHIIESIISGLVLGGSPRKFSFIIIIVIIIIIKVLLLVHRILQGCACSTHFLDHPIQILRDGVREVGAPCINTTSSTCKVTPEKLCPLQTRVNPLIASELFFVVCILDPFG